MAKLDCTHCGDEYEAKDYRADESKFCSRSCANTANAAQIAESQKDRVQCECDRCGGEYEVVRSKADRTRFCSSSCRSKQVADDVGLGTEVTPPGGRDPDKWETFECEWCGDAYEDYAHRADRTRWCSSECRHEGVGEINSGENSHLWTGNKEYDRGQNWHTQRRRARKRDDYECQRCGLHEDDHYRQLSVHHITPFDEFDGYEEANRLDNLVTMCQKCHQKVETEPEVLEI